MKIKKVFSTKFMYAITSLLFAICLFCYVNSDTGLNPVNPEKNTLTSQKSATLTVPLKVNVSSAYFVEGYPQNVKVKINGPAALVQATQNTQNFEVYADLIGLKPGSHTVKLKESGINRGLSANIQPSKITVKISKRKTVNLPVQVRFDSTLINNGYAAGIATTNYNKVKVIGSSKTISKVTNVVANVSLPEGVQRSITQNVALQALDENGNPLNVLIEPSVVKATVPIYPATTSKKVNIRLVASGVGNSNKNYSLSTNTKNVTVTGTKQALSRLNTLTVAVPINGIENNTMKNVEIETIQNGITTVSPSSINVQITVSDKGEQNNNGTSTTNTSTVQSSGLPQSNASSRSTFDKTSKSLKSSTSISVS